MNQSKYNSAENIAVIFIMISATVSEPLPPTYGYGDSGGGGGDGFSYNKK